MNHEYFMSLAIKEAENAMAHGEFPVGCVITNGETILSTGARTGTAGYRKNEIDHAEITALKNLDIADGESSPNPARNLTLYSTLEPCLMCFGAILLSGIGTIVYAYEDVMGGGTCCDLSQLPPLYQSRQIMIVNGIMRKKSLELFKSFFNNPLNNYWEASLLSSYTLDQ
ncbi:MAG: nucleoside deaminase [Proteobacteria bacterium]|nr:nucleoside deaminase [Pseudomonadota bacterium]